MRLLPFGHAKKLSPAFRIRSSAPAFISSATGSGAGARKKFCVTGGCLGAFRGKNAHAALLRRRRRAIVFLRAVERIGMQSLVLLNFLPASGHSKHARACLASRRCRQKQQVERVELLIAWYHEHHPQRRRVINFTLLNNTNFLCDLSLGCGFQSV